MVNDQAECGCCCKQDMKHFTVPHLALYCVHYVVAQIDTSVYMGSAVVWTVWYTRHPVPLHNAKIFISL